MIHDLTFERPPRWQWIETKADSPRIELHIRPSTKQLGIVTFTVHQTNDSDGTVDGTINYWARNFQESLSKLNVKKETINLNQHRLNYFTFTGTFRYFSRSVQRNISVRNFSISGTVVDEPQGKIAIILRGPADLVEKSKKEFRQMIESALKEN